MKKYIAVLIGLVSTLAISRTWATNGDNLEGIGSVSEALGGTGVAAPQDGLSALVNNPAGLSFLQTENKSEATIGTSLFKPDVKANITTPGGTLSGNSDDKVSVIPYLSYFTPHDTHWSYGIGIYGASGMGVDYRGKNWDLDGNPANGYEGDVFTEYTSLKVAPAISYKANEHISAGISLHGNYSTLDLGQGEADDIGAGFQAGIVYQTGPLQFGASYTSPQKADFDDVYNFDAFAGDTVKDSLTLEQPSVYAAGVAWKAADNLLIELNIKQLAWGSADGYGDFGWDDQWVYAIGAQLETTDKLTLRAGFNYGEHPLENNDGWNPQGVTTVQGKQVSTFGYEYLRTVGFPAIVESHVTVGFGYQINETLSFDAAYMHAFETSFSSTSAGKAISLASDLSEDSISFGLTKVF